MTSSILSLHPPFAAPTAHHVDAEAIATVPALEPTVLADRRSWLPQPFVPPVVRDVSGVAVLPAEPVIPEDTVWAEAVRVNVVAEPAVEPETFVDDAEADGAYAHEEPAVESVAPETDEIESVEATAEEVYEADEIAVVDDAAPELSMAHDAYAAPLSTEEMLADDTLPSISDFLVAGAFPESSADAPQWPIADVGAEVTRLSEGMPVAPRDERDSSVDGIESTPVQGSNETHAAWSDDEAWLDIMPAASPAVERELEAQTAWARAFGEPPAPLPSTPATGGNVFTAARALEEVARRLRAGELALPAWSPDGGEAAALAATLTALLGTRR